MDFPASPLLSADEAHQAFLDLAAGYDELAITNRKQARQALALALAGGCLDPNALSLCRNNDPVLLHVLQNLRVEASDKLLENRVDVSPEPTEPWPEAGLETISHRERLALWLIRAGADPWAKDHEGKDALDLAIEAGSRSVVATLLAHPRCPPLETLRQRTSGLPGRQVPWLHVAAYTGNAGLFEDLVALGCDLHATDRQGWSALGWVNRPAMLSHLLEHHAFSSEEVATASEAWQKRLLGKLTVHNFKVEPLREVVDSRAPVSEEQALEMALKDLTNNWLSGKPSEKTYHFKGRKLSGDPEKDKNLNDTVQAHWDWRFSVATGVAKGTWSLLGAAVWGLWRGQIKDERGDAHKHVVNWALRQLELAGPEKASAWLEEEFRPGVKNRGMIAWLVMTVGLPEQKKNLMGDQPSAIWKDMVDFAVGTKGGTDWVRHLSHQFRDAVAHYATIFPSACDAQFWHGVALFARSSGFHPSLFSNSDAPKYVHVATRFEGAMVNGTTVSEQARQAWFKALLALSSSSSYHTSSTEVVAARSRVWDVVLHARQADPDLFSFPLDAPAPFTEKEAAQKTPGGHSLPSPSEWKALLVSQKMDRDLAAIEPSAPRRPRM